MRVTGSGLRYTNPMARKRALVVDDSKSARVILSRMLEKYDIEVDMAESAEQAIEYLKSNRPDAIFMDHLMPGMDGLQAVQAIKGNPQTAMIPIMMYTSQEGELYVGQARALGAMGVLPKQVRPVDVSKVLYELHLLPDRRDMRGARAGAGGDRCRRRGRTAPHGSRAGPADWGRRIEAAVKDQAVDIRRFIVASLDSFATRIVSDVRDAMPIQAGEPLAPLPPPPPAWPWAGGRDTGRVLGCRAHSPPAGSIARNDLASARAEIAGLEVRQCGIAALAARSVRDGQGSHRRACGRERQRGGGRRRAQPPRDLRHRRSRRERSRCPTAKYPSIAAASMCCASC